MTGISGIHHVTAIARDAQKNLDFYAGFLGLRLVKRTVNFDDPHTYHFYFGDEEGTPGSIMTFFPWPRSRNGRQGAGQIGVTSFTILPSAIGFWVERLIRHGIPYEGPYRRWTGSPHTETVLAFRDHDGLMLRLVGHPSAETRTPWKHASGIPPEMGIRGIHTVELWEEDGAQVEQLLTGVLGFRAHLEDEGIRRFAVAGAGPGEIVDVRTIGGFMRATGGAGTVHHVAWSVADAAAQLGIRERVVSAGVDPTPVIDRMYFQSVYFREPGGVLFEVATEAPGFSLDEDISSLGSVLKLPPQFEGQRAEIEASLPTIHLPHEVRGPLLSAEETMNTPSLGFVHRYEPSRSESGITLLLLHGTGGDEDNLIQLGRELMSNAALLSPRGKVLENGAPRFFRRLAEGVFDQEDLALRTEELAAFIEAASREYAIDTDRLVAVGFSNGANIASSLLLRRPGLLRGAVLLSPMVPFVPDPLPSLEGTDVFIGAGRTDPMVPVDLAQDLADLLERSGAKVTLNWHPGGHAVTATELKAAQDWLHSTLGSSA